MTWAHPAILVAAPLGLLAAWWIARHAAPAELASFANIRRRWADRHGLSAPPAGQGRTRLRGLCLALGAGLALLALARPQWGERPEPVMEQAREVMLALDLSRSMLADDVAPTRLARAKLLITALLDQLRGERVGLIVFAGTAFVQSPLSADYEVLRDLLDALDPSYLPQGGTDYAAMLRTAVQGFSTTGDADRYLIVLSDGEALDDEWTGTLDALRASGIRVIGLGVATPDGALVPDGAGGIVKDEQGAAVLSRLEPATLQALAEATGGVYRDAASWVDVAALVDATVSQGRAGQHVAERHVRLHERFQWFLAPALLLLLLSYWLELPPSPLARAVPPRGRRSHPASRPVIASALVALVAWQIHSRPAHAAVPDNSPPQPGTAVQPHRLAETVAELSSRPELSPPDYARLAGETIAAAEDPTAWAADARRGVIDDALAAVDRGEAADPNAADWPRLRAALEALRDAPPPPDQEHNEQAPAEHGDQASENDAGQDQAGQAGGGDAAQGDTSNQSNGQGGGSAASNDGEQGDDSGATAGNDAQPGARSGDTGSEPSPGEQRAAGDASGSDSDDAASAGESAADHAAGDDPQTGAESQTGAAQTAPDDGEVQALQAPEASLAGTPADEDPQERSTAAAAGDDTTREPPSAPTEQRLVGGGPALAGSTAGVAGGGMLERLADGDAPAVLFERMAAAEGQPRPRTRTKDW